MHVADSNQPVGLVILGLVLGLIVTYASQNPIFIPYVIIAGLMLTLILFRTSIKETLFCSRCSGGGKILCTNTFCQDGLIHATPRYASSSSNDPLKKQENSYLYEVNDIHIASNGFPGDFRIVANVFSRGLNDLLGEYSSDILYINTNELVIPKIQIPLDANKVKRLEYGFKRSITSNDVGVNIAVNRIKKGYLCTTCNGTVTVTCPACKGKRLNRY